MKLRYILAAILVGGLMAGCTVDADDDDGTTVVPGGSSNTVIEKDTPDVHVNPAPDVNVKTDPGGTVTTTGQ
jgi:hypothetical protein